MQRAIVVVELRRSKMQVWVLVEGCSFKLPCKCQRNCTCQHLEASPQRMGVVGVVWLVVETSALLTAEVAIIPVITRPRILQHQYLLDQNSSSSHQLGRCSKCPAPIVTDTAHLSIIKVHSRVLVRCPVEVEALMLMLMQGIQCKQCHQ